MAACTSRAAASMLRLRSNCIVMLVDPKLLDEVISVTDAMRPNCRSRGVATDEAMVSGLAPGNDADTDTVGKSTCGSGDTGSIRKATIPARPIAMVKSVVATGRLMNSSDMFMAVVRVGRASTPAAGLQARPAGPPPSPYFRQAQNSGPGGPPQAWTPTPQSLGPQGLGARIDPALFLVRESPGQPVEPKINHRRRIQGQGLAENQAANHRNAQRPAQFRTHAAAESQRHRAQQGRHGGHHDRPESQQAGLINRLLWRPALFALRVQGEIDHHDTVLLYNADQQDDADQRDDAEILVEERERQQRTDTRGRQRRKNRDRMDVAFVQHP